MSQAGGDGAATALLLIDVQNSFFSPDGGNYYPESADIVDNLARLLAAARAGGRLIVHVAEQHRPGLRDFEHAKLPEHCLTGSHDAAFFEGFGPQGDGEVGLAKRRVSAFFGTDLDLLLREHAIARLVIAGVKANVCVRATVLDGFSLGYRCLVARDAVNSNRAHLAEAAFEDIDRYFGWVVSMDEAEAALT